MMRKKLLLTLALFAVFVLLFARLDLAPAPWFDEGWAMWVARNWVTTGHYAQLRDGQPVSADMLNIGLPVIASIALSFKLFGVGIVQGRLVGVLFTLAAAGLTCALGQRLYGRKTAAVATGLFLLVALLWPLPAFPARMALGEIPAVAFLLGGFVCLAYSAGRLAWAAPAGILFGLSAATKMQVLPFLLPALGLPAAFFLARRMWRPAALAVAALIAGGAAYWALTALQRGLQPVHTLAFSQADLLATTAVTLAGAPRRAAVIQWLLFAAPATILIAHALLLAGRAARRGQAAPAVTLARSGLALFALSWILWFLLFSIGWARYLLLPLAAGAILMAASLGALTGFSLRQTVQQAARGVSLRRFDPRATATTLVVVGTALFLVVSALIANIALKDAGEQGHSRTLAYLNTETSAGALLETYELELFVGLDRRYHYPPDQIQLDLNRRTFTGDRSVNIGYDPLAADPDYLVVGAMAKGWGLYDAALAGPEFERVATFGRYDVYRRARAN